MSAESKYGVQKASGLMNTSTCQGAPQLNGDRSSCAWGPSRPCRMYLTSSYSFISFIINKPVDLFPRVLSLSSKLLKPEEGTVVTPIYSPSVRSTDDNVGLVTGR